jgi:hypothetical protein
VALEVGAAFLHFNQDERLPDEIGERSAAAVFFRFADAEFGFAGFERPGRRGGQSLFSQSRKEGQTPEAVEEDLGFAFFVALDVRGGPVDEFLEAGFAVGGHGVRIHDKGEGLSMEADAGRGDGEKASRGEGVRSELCGVGQRAHE